jgi:hypothetical protein
MALLDPGGKSACGLCMLCATKVPTFVVFAFPEYSSIVSIFHIFM